MKLTLLIILCFVLSMSPVMAQTASDSASPESQKLNELKDRLASAATQLKQSQKRAIYGTVKSTSVSTLTIETTESDVKIELDDEVLVAQNIKGKRTELTTDDLTKGDTVVVFGEFDANLELMKAKIIFIQDALPRRISGTITEVDKKSFTFTVTTVQKETFIIDIETSSKNVRWTKEDGTAKGAFSKYAVGDTVTVLAEPGTSKTPNRLSALRVLDLGNITGATVSATPTP